MKHLPRYSDIGLLKKIWVLKPHTNHQVIKALLGVVRAEYFRFRAEPSHKPDFEKNFLVFLSNFKYFSRMYYFHITIFSFTHFGTKIAHVLNKNRDFESSKVAKIAFL